MEQELHKVAEILYKAQTAEGAGGAAQGEPAASADAEGEVVDAEYTEDDGKGDG